jgi:cathepsin L
MISKLATAFLCFYATGSEGTASFDAFVQKHGRSYRKGTQEYEERRGLFEKRVADVEAQNSKTNKRWTAGVNKLADWNEGELQHLRGWDGSVRPHNSGSRTVKARPAFLQQSSRDSAELPEEKSWANLETASHIHNQGGCGSCWAIASSTVLEYHTEIHGKRRTFSPQQIVDCTPNPRDCGGTGMCDGATAELAMDWVLKNGCASSDEVPYTGENGQCGAESGSALMMSQLLGGAGAANKGNAFGMSGWEKLPQNDQESLMRALVERGPVAISVGAGPWQSYESGVFDSCEKDSIIDHAVVAMAYGKDDSTSSKYWQIQNSWGRDWGESGHIRVLRQDDPSSYCGTDNKPQEGTACKGENDPVTVCGMCGMLFDSVVPHFD